MGLSYLKSGHVALYGLGKEPIQDDAHQLARSSQDARRAARQGESTLKGTQSTANQVADAKDAPDERYPVNGLRAKSTAGDCSHKDCERCKHQTSLKNSTYRPPRATPSDQGWRRVLTYAHFPDWVGRQPAENAPAEVALCQPAVEACDAGPVRLRANAAPSPLQQPHASGRHHQFVEGAAAGVFDEFGAGLINGIGWRGEGQLADENFRAQRTWQIQAFPKGLQAKDDRSMASLNATSMLHQQSMT